MLRQADLDHQSLGPAAAVTAVENACHALSLDATGTLVHAHLHPLDTGGGWQLTWTNAGHPPPLLVHPGARTERLASHDLLLWPGMPDSRRADRQRVLAPGATLLLYTDGLVERRGTDTSLAIDRAAAILAAAPADQPLPDLLQTVLGEVAGPSSRDDIVLLAVQVPAG
jgi:serine phosphatase RsbU (regulator of sigma subunit)